LRVLWMAEEMGIQCEIEPVEFRGPKTEAFKAANLFMGPEAERSNWTVGMIKEGFIRRSRLVANQLVKHEFLAADRFTAADISVAYALGIGLGLLEMGDQLDPAVVDYYNRMTARPAYQRAAAK
jgi:glutathione S-transferase